MVEQTCAHKTGTNVDVSVYGFRRARPSSIDAASSEIVALCRAWTGLLPAGTKWTVLTPSYDRLSLRGTKDVEIALRTSVPSRRIEIDPTAPTYSVTLFASLPAPARKAAARELVRMHVGFCLPAERNDRPNTYFEASFKSASFTSGAELRARIVEAVTGAARTLAFDWLQATSGKAPRPSGYREAAARVGWLTYLSKSLGPLPHIPPPTETASVDDLGWILVAQPDLVEASNPALQASMAYVRHALGARVLLDGPAFPPDSRAQEAPANTTPPVALGPPPEVPSYLKDPKEAPPDIAPGQLVAPAHRDSLPEAFPPAPKARPLVTETAAVDVSKILTAAVPFDPHGPPSTPAAVPSVPKEPRARAATSSETGPVDVSMLLRAAAPFEVKAAVAGDPPRARAPLSTETAEVDVSKLVREVVPFGSNPGGAEGSPSAAPAPDSGSKEDDKLPVGFGETAEFTLESLLRGAPGVPFGQKAAPKTTALPAVSESRAGAEAAVPPAAPQRRLVRFDPQTGRPLAQPYWEELPAMEKKDR